MSQSSKLKQLAMMEPDSRMQTTPTARQNAPGQRFGSNVRNTIISDKQIKTEGPSPAEYDHHVKYLNTVVLQSNKVPVMKQRTALDSRV